MAPTVLVTGASGLLGRGVVRELQQAGRFEVTGVAYSRTGPGLVQCDLTDSDALRGLIESARPTVLIHCAAERRPDACENDAERVKRLNVALPEQLAALATEFDFGLYYISTDYVFPGDAPEGGYEPTDMAAPTNAYGQSKLDGERVVVKAFDQGVRGCVLRVPVLYGQVERNDESAVNVLVNSVRAIDSGKEVKMDDWATRYPTNVDDVGFVLAQLLTLEKKLPPVLHFSSQKCYTKLSICEMLASLHSPPLKLDAMVPVREGPKPGETLRPRDCHLSNAQLHKLGVEIRETDVKGWFKKELASSH